MFRRVLHVRKNGAVNAGRHASLDRRIHQSTRARFWFRRTDIVACDYRNSHLPFFRRHCGIVGSHRIGMGYHYFWCRYGISSMYLQFRQLRVW